MLSPSGALFILSLKHPVVNGADSPGHFTFDFDLYQSASMADFRFGGSFSYHYYHLHGRRMLDREGTLHQHPNPKDAQASPRKKLNSGDRL